MLSAVLVDDEESSVRNLELLLAETGYSVQVIGKAYNALQAVQLIFTKRPDLVFLDVHMPGFTGFDVLDQIRETEARVVFTTAHRNYAITALRKGAFDYILKPVDLGELQNCLKRAEKECRRRQSAPGGLIEINVKDGIIFVRTSELVRLEASGSYTIFHLDNNVKHIASKTLKEYEGLLDSNNFFRCHNSHMINLRKVVRYINTNGHYAELSNGSIIEIARKNKELFLEKLKNLQL